ncbi:MAG: DNA mismatch endonuclease Vsr [Pseudodesulfovibrio sp.]|nr:DNA mismatch endonuclease Vsr [Pseudodesulfovibrio sp.]
MTDTISKERRSWNMSRIKGKDTGPELILRSLLHREGFRFRLHDPKLPGHPDIVLKKYESVIFVNGCYWHRHQKCPKATTPKTRTSFWLNKFAETVERDKRKCAELEELGWNVIIVWECQLKEAPQRTLTEVRNQLERI